MSFNS